MSSHDTEEIAQAAARLIAEEGLDWGAAKQRALRDQAWPRRTPLPSNDALEDALHEYLALFQADTQPTELHALRKLALQWMQRLAAFEPLLAGGVWRGTANRLSDLHLLLYSDDPKAPEIALLNLGQSPEPGASLRDVRGQAQQTLLIWLAPPPGLPHPVALHMTVLGSVERRGALLPDTKGRRLRGDTTALRRLVEMAV